MIVWGVHLDAPFFVVLLNPGESMSLDTDKLMDQSATGAVLAILDHWHTKKHPFFQALLAGDLPLRALGVYMALHNQFVSTALPSLGLLFYRSPPDVRIFQLENLAEEAGLMAGPGEGRVAHDHTELIFRFCKAAGMDESEVRNIDVPAGWWGRNLHYLRTAAEEPVGVVLAMQATQEGQQVDLNREVTIPGLTTHYGFAKDSPEIEFFAEHEVADQDHAGRQLEMCGKYVTDDALKARMIEVCDQACRLRWASITDVYRAEMLGEQDPLP